ncbi:ATP-dependent RNA helicase DDX24 [Stigmatopora nigra]
MDGKKKKPWRRSFASSKKKKRDIRATGEWKAVDMDPQILADSGLDGLICFEKLTEYTLVDSKKKKKKRKSSEAEKGDLDSKASEKTSEPPKKKKKNKFTDDESIQSTDDESIQSTDDESIQSTDDESIQSTDDDSIDDESEMEELQEDTSDEESRTISETKSKNKKKTKNKKKKQKATDAAKESNTTTQDKEIKPKKQLKNWTNNALSGSGVENVDMHTWNDLYVPPIVLKALSNLGFTSPTPIQALVLPSAIRDRLDILGAAETGSGKTLAFGIPMIHNILEWKENFKKPGNDDEAPDVKHENPTASPEPDAESLKGEDEGEESITEVAEQGEPGEDKSDGITEVAEQGESGEDKNDGEEEQDGKLGCVKVIKDVKFDEETAVRQQSALDDARPLLGLVLTPTRELAVQVKHHIDAVAKLTDIKTAIVVGGMAPQKQRRMLNYRPEIIIATPGRMWDLIREKHPHLVNLKHLKTLVIDEADRMIEKGHYAELESLLEMLNTTHLNPKRQNLVFSATLTMTHNMPIRLLKKKTKMLHDGNKVALLVEKVGMKSKPKVVDLTRKEATAETLTETQIHCQKEEKDFFLYYFLLQYPGRTMVFANSIETIKRLNSLLMILDRTPLPLHGNMHQKHRLKNLERFAERESCVLLTTDVAARGLDIPNVQHVIHYQVPRTSETYVHRSGRTARATKEGLSLLLVSPEDVINFRKIYRNLGKDEGLPTFPVEIQCMAAIKERVKLAWKIEKLEFYNCRQKRHNSWLKQTADAMEITLDEDLLLGQGRDDDDDREQKMMVKGMKKQLKFLISQNLFKNMTKTRYPTQMGKLCLSNLPYFGEQSAITRLTAQQSKITTPIPQSKKAKKKGHRRR